MMYLFFVVIGLFFYDGTMHAMSEYSHDDYSSIVAWNEPDVESVNFVQHSVENKEKIKNYFVQGVTKIIFDGGNDQGVRMQVNVTQITDNHSTENMAIQAHKNSYSYIRNGDSLEIALHRTLNQKMASADNVVIFLALKKYEEITAKNNVDLTFSSPIKENELAMKIATGATAATKNSAQLIADTLAIKRQGNTSVNLAIDTKLLYVDSNGTGTLRLSGNAVKQKLYLEEGSYLAKKLCSERIGVVIRAGRGKIRLHASQFINGTCSDKSEHDESCRVDYDYQVRMYFEDDVLKQYAEELKECLEKDVLRFKAWDIDIDLMEKAKLLFLNQLKQYCGR